MSDCGMVMSQSVRGSNCLCKCDGKSEVGDVRTRPVRLNIEVAKAIYWFVGIWEEARYMFMKFGWYVKGSTKPLIFVLFKSHLSITNASIDYITRAAALLTDAVLYRASADFVAKKLSLISLSEQPWKPKISSLNYVPCSCTTWAIANSGFAGRLLFPVSTTCDCSCWYYLSASLHYSITWRPHNDMWTCFLALVAIVETG
jgi:hypothetical protein